MRDVTFHIHLQHVYKRLKRTIVIGATQVNYWSQLLVGLENGRRRGIGGGAVSMTTGDILLLDLIIKNIEHLIKVHPIIPHWCCNVVRLLHSPD